MYTYIEKRKHVAQINSKKTEIRLQQPSWPNHIAPPGLHLQRTVGNQAIIRTLGVSARAHIIVSRSQYAISHAPPTIQRWDAPEHIELGERAGGATSGLVTLECHNQDFPQRKLPMVTWPLQWRQLCSRGTHEQKRAIVQGLTYGEIMALSGDLYASFTELNRASLREIYDLIPLVRGYATTTQLQAATGGRYLALAQRNESHFSNVRPGHRSIDTWREMHIQAIQAARSRNANLAWAVNAAADHFLTDSFCSGHIRTPRSRLMGSNLRNIESKILHDLDNEYGVVVTNRRGDPAWIAYGEGERMFADPRNRRNLQLAEEAVRLSRSDISAALSQGNAYPSPQPSSVFQAELLVPTAIDPSQDRWTGRSPTYMIDPASGQSVRQPDDYSTMRDKVIVKEAPGIVAGFFNDDNQIRTWVANQSLAAIGRQPPGQKIRMINTLMDGWISDADVAAIERICHSVIDAGEMATIRNAINPRLNSMRSLGQRTRVRGALLHL